MLLPFGVSDTNTTKNRASEDIEQTQTPCPPLQVCEKAEGATGYLWYLRAASGQYLLPQTSLHSMFCLKCKNWKRIILIPSLNYRDDWGQDVAQRCAVLVNLRVGGKGGERRVCVCVFCVVREVKEHEES